MSCFLYKGDCLDIMGNLPDKSVDMILCDLPYGTTACKWDVLIPFEDYIEIIENNKIKRYNQKDYVLKCCEQGKSYNNAVATFEHNCKQGLWTQYKRIIKENGAIVLFGTEPFGSYMRMSNIESFKYDWIWEKENGTNFATVNYQPFRKTEKISVFGNFATSYNKAKPKNYNPQFTEGKPYEITRKAQQREQLHKGANKATTLKNTGFRYPTDLITFKNEKGLHPTQKPVPLLEYLVKTYTNEGDVVLDNCMGSGSTGVACINTNRNFIGIEADDNYFSIAKKRLEESELKL